MAVLPRHCFCLAGTAAAAYEDHALAIGGGQTISQPSLIAAMLAYLQIKPGMRIMDIGSGSGYVSALLATLLRGNGQVLALERIASLQERARDICDACLNDAEKNCIQWQVADASLGAADQELFDAIHVACVFPELPLGLIDQLNIGGRMVIPVGEGDDQELIGIVKNKNDFEQTKLMNVLFVPLRSGTE
jgi:protein-L-isoaspartate(D-aspartate) O-methyltransferase